MKTSIKAIFILGITTVIIFIYTHQNPTENNVYSQNSQSQVYDGIIPNKLSNTRIESKKVHSVVSIPITRVGDRQEEIEDGYTVFEKITPKNNNNPKSQFIGKDKFKNEILDVHQNISNRSVQSTIDAGTTTTNITNTGSLFIPADSHGAAGPNHVVNVLNTTIEFYQKDGTQDFSISLMDFFISLSPINFTFDPKVIYDQFEGRWVVVTLVRSDAGAGTSLVLVAVSDDTDPNGIWTTTEIDTSIEIGGNDHWFDYPGLAVDDQVIYITGNMFRYFDGTAGQGSNGGSRLIIIDKGVTGGLYDGMAASVSITDPVTTSGSFNLSHTPAQIYGTAPGDVGTWLVGYSGVSQSGNSAVQMIRVDDPLGTISFTRQLEQFGNVDGLTIALPNAPQSGTASGVLSNDRRVYDAVWRDDSLFFTTHVQSNDADNMDEATAYWGEIDTSTLTNPDFTQGNIIGGEDDIGVGTYTSFPSIAVNSDGGVTVGFSASNSSIFPSSYFINRSPTDPLNSMRPAKLISAGQAFYVRTFGGTNRWGDYSATSVDPDDECFWMYNKHAITQGNATEIGNTGVFESGRYGTSHAHFCNDAPVATTDATTVDQGLTVTTVNGIETSLIENDTDDDLPEDTLSMQTTAVSGPNNGIVTLNSNGTFTYTHNNSATTDDSFVYRVCDDGSPVKCDDGTVDITINPVNPNLPPVANNDAITVDEGGTQTVLDSTQTSVLSNDVDPDDFILAAVINMSPTQSSSFTFNANGTFSYTHNGGEITTDSFTYDACDDNMPTPACDTATVNISINPINDEPITLDDSFSVDEGGSTSTLTGGSMTVLNNDTDNDDTLSASVNTGPTHASSFMLNTDGTFSYTHNGNEMITDSFTYDACDDNKPTPACDTATVNITINPVNDIPNALDDAFSLDEGGTSDTLSGGSMTVLNNDTDDDDTLSTTVNTGPTHASSFNLNSDGTFSYTHKGNEMITDSFTYDACDDEMPTPACDTATVNITINPINDNPIAENDAINVEESGTAVTLAGGASSVLDNDTDNDDTLSATVNTGPLHASSFTLNLDGTFSYTHNGGIEISDGFTYDACDDNMPTPACDTATVNIVIGPINDEPNAGDDSFTVDEGGTTSTLTGGSMTVLNNDIDNDDTLTSTINISPVNASSFSLNLDGTFSYTHDGSETLSDSFTYDACDDNMPTPACDTATVSITINPVNDSPSANNDSFSVDEGDTTSLLTGGSDTVLNNDSDNDGILTVTVNLAPINASSFTLNLDGTFSYSHDSSETITDSFTYDACDDNMPTPACDTATVSITINPVNDAPIAISDNTITTLGGTVTVVNGGQDSLLENDSDIENDSLSLVTTPSSSPSHGSVTLNANGTFSYTNDGSNVLSDSFDYEVCDNGSPIECSIATVNITLDSDVVYANGFEETP